MCGDLIKFEKNSHFSFVLNLLIHTRVFDEIDNFNLKKKGILAIIWREIWKFRKKKFFFSFSKKGGVNNNSGAFEEESFWYRRHTHTRKEKNVPVLIVFKKKKLKKYFYLHSSFQKNYKFFNLLAYLSLSFG